MSDTKYLFDESKLSGGTADKFLFPKTVDELGSTVNPTFADKILSTEKISEYTQ